MSPSSNWPHAICLRLSVAQDCLPHLVQGHSWHTLSNPMCRKNTGNAYRSHLRLPVVRNANLQLPADGRSARTLQSNYDIQHSQHKPLIRNIGPRTSPTQFSAGADRPHRYRVAQDWRARSPRRLISAAISSSAQFFQLTGVISSFTPSFPRIKSYPFPSREEPSFRLGVASNLGTARPVRRQRPDSLTATNGLFVGGDFRLGAVQVHGNPST